MRATHRRCRPEYCRRLPRRSRDAFHFANLRGGATPAEIQNPRILRRRHTLCTAATGDGLPCSGRYLSAATGQCRPLGVAEAVFPAGELAHGILPRPSGRRKTLRGFVMEGKRVCGIRRTTTGRILPEAHSDVAGRTRGHGWTHRGRRGRDSRCGRARRRWGGGVGPAARHRPNHEQNGHRHATQSAHRQHSQIVAERVREQRPHDTAGTRAVGYIRGGTS